MRQPASPEGVAGTQPHVTVRVRIWLRKKAALYTITLRFFKYLRPPRRRGGLDVPKTMQYPQPASTSWRSDSAGNVTVKSAAEQESMRVAGRLASQVLDMIGQHELLSEAATLVEAGTLRTTLTTNLGKINAANLRRAHKMLEEGHTVGKIVLEGF